MEERFVDGWYRVTRAIHACCGGYGSRLHPAADGTWFACARWRDAAKQAACDHGGSDGRRLMTEATACLEQLPADIVLDLLDEPQSTHTRPRRQHPPESIMNSPEAREIGPHSAGQTVPSSALLSALTTEHYTLQSSRSSTIVEANGRSSLFLSAVNGALVALALVAQLDRLGHTFLVFAFSVLPALLMLGVMSYARLADLAVHDAYYARAIGRIRSFYFEVAGPDARQYWLMSAGDDKHTVMRHVGQRLTPWHHWTHQATAVAAVTAVIAGVLSGLAVDTATSLTLPGTAVLGVVVAAGVLGVLLADQERRWRHSERRSPSLFAPDGAPHTVAPAVPVETGAAPAACHF